MEKQILQKYKVIFLDVDGVINNAKTKEKSYEDYTGIEDKLVKLVKTIIDKTDAKVVLTSTWKKAYLQKEPDGIYLDQKLKKQGIKIFDTTINEDNMSDRGKQIKTYLDNHKDILNFVILDDEFLEFFKRYNLERNLVYINYLIGITKEDAERAINVLNNSENKP